MYSEVIAENFKFNFNKQMTENNITENNNLENNNENKSFFSEIKDFSLETIKIVVVSLVIIVAVRTYVMQPFFVSGKSMEPNFHDGDYLIIDEISYRIDEPKRGDVIIFRYPRNPKEFFIKGLQAEDMIRVVVNIRTSVMITLLSFGIIYSLFWIPLDWQTDSYVIEMLNIISNYSCRPSMY